MNGRLDWYNHANYCLEAILDSSNEIKLKKIFCDDSELEDYSIYSTIGK
jgi:hypothetical protein